MKPLIPRRNSPTAAEFQAALVEAKREQLIQDAHVLRMQGRYEEAAEMTRELRELSP